MSFWNLLEFKKKFLSLVEQARGLDVVLKIANQSGIRYALFGTAYVNLAIGTGKIHDIDFLTNAYGIRELMPRFPEAILKKSQPGFATQFLYPLGTSLIEFTADIEVYNKEHKYSFYLTDLVWKYTQRVVISSYQLYLVNPWEMVFYKAILQRGQDQGKDDLGDIKKLLKFVYLNPNYVYPRLKEINPDERLLNCLAQFGIQPPPEEEEVEEETTNE